MPSQILDVLEQFYSCTEILIFEEYVVSLLYQDIV